MGRLALLVLTGLIISTTMFVLSINNNQIQALDTTLFANGVIQARNVSNSFAMAAVSELQFRSSVPKEELVYTLNSEFRQVDASKLVPYSTASVKVEDNLMTNGLDENEIMLTSVATIRNVGTYEMDIVSQTTVISKEIDFGDFALFINDFNYKALATTELVRGDTHVNGTFGVKGAWGETGPIFEGDITSVEPPIFSGTMNPDAYFGFLGDTDFNSQEIPFPTFNITPTTHPNMLNLDQLGMRYVKFLSNGDVLLSNAHGGLGHKKLIKASDMINKYGGMIYGSGSGGPLTNKAVHIEGEVNGNYTVVGPDQIYITGNITYVPDPRVDTTSTSLLGIMTHSDIVTDWRYGTNSGTRDSMMVMASMYAEGTVRAGDHGKPGDYGNFTVYGSRLQGYFSEMLDNDNQIWHQKILYDERLKYLNPPNLEFEEKRIITEWYDSI